MITVHGTRQTQQALEQIARRAVYPQPAFQDVVDDFHKRERKRFRTRGGGFWRPLRQRTIERRRHAGRGGRRVLRDSDALYRSLTSRTRGSVVEIGRTKVVMGTDLSYAGYQDKRRKLIHVGARERRAWGKIVGDYVVGG